MWISKYFKLVCDYCGHKDRHFIDRDQLDWTWMCPECNRSDYHIDNGYVKKPYFVGFTTEEITGQPVEVTSPGQRDALLREHGLTMDRYSKEELARRRSKWEKETSMTSNLTYDKVMSEIKKQRGEWS